MLDVLKELVRISDRDHVVWDKAKIIIAQLEGQKPKTGIIPMSKLHFQLWDDVIYKGSCPDAEEAMRQHVEAWDPETHPCMDSYLDSVNERLTGVESWTGELGDVVWSMHVISGVPHIQIEASPHLTLAKEQAYNDALAVPKPKLSGAVLCYTVPEDWWV